MKTRCSNPNCPFYSRYGGRGISICEEWLTFPPFYEWSIANGYNDDLTIDRIDNSGNYEPSNCKWSTQQEQSLNKEHLKSKTGYVGVRKHSGCRKFAAEVWNKQKCYYVGLFDTPEIAYEAREKYISENHLQMR